MHDEFPAVDKKHQEIVETAKTLDRIAYELAELSRIKEELDKRMNALLNHGEEGQRTYVEGPFKITLRSGYNYTLDKEKYEMLSRHLNSSIDPVEKKVKYEINKKKGGTAIVYSSSCRKLQYTINKISRRMKIILSYMDSYLIINPSLINH